MKDALFDKPVMFLNSQTLLQETTGLPTDNYKAALYKHVDACINKLLQEFSRVGKEKLKDLIGSASFKRVCDIPEIDESAPLKPYTPASADPDTEWIKECNKDDAVKRIFNQ